MGGCIPVSIVPVYNNTYLGYQCRVPLSQVVEYDELEGIAAFGGSDIADSFVGYLGDGVIYRGKAIPISQVNKASFEMHEGHECMSSITGAHPSSFSSHVSL